MVYTLAEAKGLEPWDPKGPKDPKEVVCVLVLVEVVRAKYHLGTICGLGGLGPK